MDGVVAAMFIYGLERQDKLKLLGAVVSFGSFTFRGIRPKL